MKVLKLKGELRNPGVSASGKSKQQTVTKERLLRIVRHPDGAMLMLGIVIGLGVCAPLIGGNRAFLLDWSIGPHVGVSTPAALGLNGGLTPGVVDSVVVALLNRLLGGAATWLPILVFFPIATVGAGRLAGRSRWSRMAAGTLYAVNPFVFNRLYVGHLPLLIGYALLPFATAAAIRSIASPVTRWSVTALWWAGLTSLSPHFAWIYGLVVVGVAVIAVSTRQQAARRAVGWFTTCVGVFALTSMYIILPHAATNLPTRVGSVSLSLYRTTGDPHLGLFANVVSLYGFWRTGPGPELPKDVIHGWPFIMFAILVIIAVGVWSALRKTRSEGEEMDDFDPLERVDTSSWSRSPKEAPVHVNSDTDPWLRFDQRRLAILLVFVGVAGYFLALGNQGPTGGLFLWAYNHVPFFALMREPQKFLMLLALAYAVFFGWGVERLLQIYISPSRVRSVATAALVGVVLPLSYTVTIFNGLDGQITTSPLPASYQQADTIMGLGVGNILFLPWHIYMEYPFTNGRVVANVAPTSFRRNVISGDNVEANNVETQSTSPRSAYLQKLFTDGPHLEQFGTLVAPLGVQYVVLAKTVDWTSYSWITHQKDLKLVLNTPSLEVWRNTAYGGVGQRVAKPTSVSGVSGLLTLARFNELGDGAVVTSRGSSSSSGTISKTSTSAQGLAKSRDVQQLSPVAYRIATGPAGWVVVDTPYERGWSLNGRPAIESAEGTVLVRVGRNGGVLQYSPWGMVRLGYTLSAAVVFVCALILVVARRRRFDSSSV